MKLKLIAPLLLALIAAPAFAHSDHDDHGPVVKPGKQVSKQAPAGPAAEDEAAKPATKNESPALAPEAPAPKAP